MSDERRLKSELRQGFHQFAMHMYQSYLQSHTEEEAKSLVSESIKEQLRLFMGSDSSLGDATEIINAKIAEFGKQRAQNPKDYDVQMYYSEKIEALRTALAILNK